MTASEDALVIVYDYLDFSILSVLAHPDAASAVSSGAPIPISVVIVVGRDVCASYTDQSLVCYDPVTGLVTFIRRNLPENYLSLWDDKVARLVTCSSESHIVVYDLENNVTFASVM